MRTLTTVLALAMLVAFLPAAPAGAITLPADDFETVEIYDELGQLLYRQTLEPSNPLLIKTEHFLRFAENNAKGGKPGGGGGGPATDCSSDANRLTGWHWTSAYSAKAASYASQGSSAGNAWDSETGASIFGGITSGSSGTAGTLDGVNQIAWVSLGASTTVAVTTTWSYRGSGEAVESDGQYNTYYPWATNGASNAMDAQGVMTHEIGHTFGLDHPNGNGASCLTMYAYVNYGETHQRTLGDGDILGIQAIYGA